MSSQIDMTLMANIDEMMFSCGVKVLHPGGLEKTFEMADDCKINKDSKILDIGSGRGLTAVNLAEKYGCSVVGVEISKNMVEYAQNLVKKKKLSQRISFINRDAHMLPFENDTFDVVFAECSTVLMDKEKAFLEFLSLFSAHREFRF